MSFAPEDDPHFDPEDDRAEYVADTADDALTFADTFYASIWPESIDS